MNPFAKIYGAEGTYTCIILEFAYCQNACKRDIIFPVRVLGDKYTIIAGDQATYELAVAIRNKHHDEFCNVVLLLGGFHQASTRETQQWKPQVESVLKILFEKTTTGTQKLEAIKMTHPQLAVLREQLLLFQESLSGQPTAVFWATFLEMSNILHRFIYYEREADWTGHLCESARMLPYLTAAGHYKYGQQSLPLYLAEMKKLPETAPEVHEALMAGVFVGRRADGSHNSVSLDMLLEQTYNADAKEASGLDGITLNPAARTKWVYTKPLTAAVSAELKSMLHLHSYNPHHESGQSRVTRDAEMVVKVMAALETNPFTVTTSSLINISTGQCADSAVMVDLIGVKELGRKALCESLSSDQKKTCIVKLNTFHTQNTKSKKSKGKTSAPGKSNEITALLRMTQIIASGGELDLPNFIGNHECSDFPSSLFQEDSRMRTGTKASLVKVLKEHTKVTIIQELPKDERKTSVVIDAMYAIRHWSFQKGEAFGAIAERYQRLLLKDVPANTDIIHFCCDRTAEQEHRYVHSKLAKEYEVSAQYTAPDPQEFFAVSENKANLLRFLCEEWCQNETLKSALGTTHLYLSGGFKDETRSAVIKEGCVVDVPALESTQQEADTRVILHTIYSVQAELSSMLMTQTSSSCAYIMLPPTST